MIAVRYPYALAAVFLWLGFVGAISFMESWLKFKAPGITVSLGLGIGKLVFNALNKIEWILAIIILINFTLSKTKTIEANQLFYLITLIILVIQTFWLLPALDVRAELYINGQNTNPSKLHIYFVAMECIKVISLFIFGTTLFKQ